MLQVINHQAAAGDVGSETIHVSIAGGPVKVFGTMTRQLQELRDYLQANKVNAFAMEFTGVYWMPLYEILEKTSIAVCLVNGAHVKMVPGRKTDVADCQWLAELHAHGLLKAGFVPALGIRKLRSYMRLRDNHILQGGSHLQQMQKAMELMNIKVHDVLSDLVGKSGQRIVQAIIAGERDTEKLVALCDESILKKKRQRMKDALQGTWAEEHVFALKQAWEAWEFCRKQIEGCDVEVQKVLVDMAEQTKAAGTGEKAEEGKVKRMGKNAPKIMELHQLLSKILQGNDPSKLPGLTDYSVLQLVSEIGTDLSSFATKKHFTGWLGLAPGSRNSGKRRRRQSRKGGRAGQIFRGVAQTVGNGTKCGLGAFYRRIRSHRGGLVASKALGRKIAELYYDVMTKGMKFVEEGMAAAEKRYEEESHKRLQRMAKKLGYVLLPASISPEPNTA
jgi:transposase